MGNGGSDEGIDVCGRRTGARHQCDHRGDGRTGLAADKLLGVSWQHFREERWKKYDEACMLDQLKKYPDWDYISTDANASAEKQNADIETLISRGVTALLIVPYSTDAVKPAAQVALANGIPTVGYDIQVEEPGVFYLSFDNAEVGRIQARGVVDIVNKGRFAYIKGSPTMEITEFVWGGQVEILTPYIEKAISRSSASSIPTAGCRRMRRSTWSSA